jgi:NifU-like protein involved in Fe-S cluster formation
LRSRDSKSALPYSETFKDHLARPRNAGLIQEPDASAEVTNPVCGDRLQLFLRIDGGRVREASFLAYGCPPTIACGSALTELLNGITIDEARAITRQDIARALDGLPTRRTHAAALALETLRAALSKLPT